MRHLLLLVLLTTPAYSQSSVYIDQVGNSNNITVDQIGDGKQAIVLNQGNNNSIGITQQDEGEHMAFIGTPQQVGTYITTTVPNNNNNTLNINQSGSGKHTAAINLDPATANSNNSATITQGGAANKTFTLGLSGSGILANVLQDNPNTSDSGSMNIQCLTPPCTGYSYTKR